MEKIIIKDKHIKFNQFLKPSIISQDYIETLTVNKKIKVNDEIIKKRSEKLKSYTKDIITEKYKFKIAGVPKCS